MNIIRIGLSVLAALPQAAFAAACPDAGSLLSLQRRACAEGEFWSEGADHDRAECYFEKIGADALRRARFFGSGRTRAEFAPAGDALFSVQRPLAGSLTGESERWSLWVGPDGRLLAFYRDRMSRDGGEAALLPADAARARALLAEELAYWACGRGDA